jgi:hypothetical protein
MLQINHNQRENYYNEGSNKQSCFSVNSYNKYSHALQKAGKNVINKTNLEVHGINTRNERYVQVPSANLTIYQKRVH